jgi:hypothetical protein
MAETKNKKGTVDLERVKRDALSELRKKQYEIEKEMRRISK